jgi:anti-sigma regulatory factor (Ser/Thr protein kinase)
VTLTKAQKTEQIRNFILDGAEAHPEDIAALTGRRFGITRQAVNRHIRYLVDEQLLAVEGRTQGTRYIALARRISSWFTVANLAEHEVWMNFAQAFLADLSSNVKRICEYGFTEMLNNVIDHSQSERVLINIRRDPRKVEFTLADQGVGIFAKIKEAYKLDDARHAIFELSKGKLTTDPTKHTGEGIFFTSRVFDHFSILSSRLFMAHTREENDWLVDDDDPGRAVTPGTFVSLEIDPNSDHTLEEVFDKYASAQDDYAFNKTKVLVNISQKDESLVSRSQAKRILARLDRFKEVALDFKGVDRIGPSFADEVFRVFTKTHPQVQIHLINANDEIDKMYRRAIAHREADASGRSTFDETAPD